MFAKVHPQSTPTGKHERNSRRNRRTPRLHRERELVATVHREHARAVRQTAVEAPGRPNTGAMYSSFLGTTVRVSFRFRFGQEFQQRSLARSTNGFFPETLSIAHTREPRTYPSIRHTLTHQTRTRHLGRCETRSFSGIMASAMNRSSRLRVSTGFCRSRFSYSRSIWGKKVDQCAQNGTRLVSKLSSKASHDSRVSTHSVSSSKFDTLCQVLRFLWNTLQTRENSSAVMGSVASVDVARKVTSLRTVDRCTTPEHLPSDHSLNSRVLLWKYGTFPVSDSDLGQFNR